MADDGNVDLLPSSLRHFLELFRTPSAPPPPPQRWDAPYAELPPSRIRNFCIVAHIDHGKSTLADRLLEATGSLVFDERGLLLLRVRPRARLLRLARRGNNRERCPPTGSNNSRRTNAAPGRAQYLDGMDLERERGITIKLNSARMRYRSASRFEGDGEGGGRRRSWQERNGEGDRVRAQPDRHPGPRRLQLRGLALARGLRGRAAGRRRCQGVEAQTLANVYLALDAGLEIIPVINKIDLPAADPESVRREIEEVIGIDASGAILTSAKRGTGISEVLEAIVTRLPPHRKTPARTPSGP